MKHFTTQDYIFYISVMSWFWEKKSFFYIWQDWLLWKHLCVWVICNCAGEPIMWELIPAYNDWRGGQFCSIGGIPLFPWFFFFFCLLLFLVLPCMWPARCSRNVYNGLRYPTILWLPGVSLFHLGHHPVYGSYQRHLQICKTPTTAYISIILLSNFTED